VSGKVLRRRAGPRHAGADIARRVGTPEIRNIARDDDHAVDESRGGNPRIKFGDVHTTGKRIAMRPTDR
jgi:hypothetical protein